MLLVSCFREHISVRPNTRVSITGALKDGEGNPVSGISILSFGQEYPFNFFVYSGAVLGKGFSDSQGNISFESLDTNNWNFAISVNPPDSKEYNPLYGTLNYIDSIDNHGRYIQLENQILKKKSTSVLKLTNSTGDTIHYKIKFPASAQQYLIENRHVGDTISSRNFSNFVIVKNDLGAGHIANIPVNSLKNSDLIIFYSASNAGEQARTIPLINQDTINFEF